MEIVSRSNAELAYQVAFHGDQAAKKLDVKGFKAWVLQVVDVFDKSGLYAAVEALGKVEAFIEQHQ